MFKSQCQAVNSRNAGLTMLTNYFTNRTTNALPAFSLWPDERHSLAYTQIQQCISLLSECYSYTTIEQLNKTWNHDLWTL